MVTVSLATSAGLLFGGVFAPAATAPAFLQAPAAVTVEVSTAASHDECYTLRRGSRDRQCVRIAQRLLRYNHARCIAIDGKFGPETERAVRDTQRKQRIPVDGVIGNLTWEVLDSRAHKYVCA